MYTRILIATGGSPWSDAAAAYAIALAAHLGADLCILAVLNVSGVYAMPDVMATSELFMESVEQQGQEMLRLFLPAWLELGHQIRVLAAPLQANGRLPGLMRERFGASHRLANDLLNVWEQAQGQLEELKGSPDLNTLSEHGGFRTAWQLLMGNYGHLGPWALDLTQPRFADREQPLLELLVLPGSANLVGGRGYPARLHFGRSAAEMRFPGAKDVLKMAFGENPRRVYGQDRKAAPATRMGNVAGYRQAFAQAREYMNKREDWLQKKEKKPDAAGPEPLRDLKLETLAEVLPFLAAVERR